MAISPKLAQALIDGEYSGTAGQGKANEIIESILTEFRGEIDKALDRLSKMAADGQGELDVLIRRWTQISEMVNSCRNNTGS